MEIDIKKIPLIVLYLDQGGKGVAALNYARGPMELMVWPFWDLFHRGPIHFKGSLSKAARGLYRRIMLLSSFPHKGLPASQDKYSLNC